MLHPIGVLRYEKLNFTQNLLCCCSPHEKGPIDKKLLKPCGRNFKVHTCQVKPTTSRLWPAMQLEPRSQLFKALPIGTSNNLELFVFAATTSPGSRWTAWCGRSGTLDNLALSFSNFSWCAQSSTLLGSCCVGEGCCRLSQTQKIDSCHFGNVGGVRIIYLLFFYFFQSGRRCLSRQRWRCFRDHRCACSSNLKWLLCKLFVVVRCARGSTLCVHERRKERM